MAGFDYARSLATANRLIARFGQTGILRRPTTSGGSTYDPTPGAPIDYPITFVTTDFSFAERSDSRVRVTDKKVLLAVPAVVPVVSDLVVIGGVEHSIPAQGDGLGIKPLNPGGTVLLYEIHCRA